MAALQPRNHIANHVHEILKLVGEAPDREGLRDTPQRVARAYQELLSGYSVDPQKVLRCFDSDGHDELVLLTNIPFYSLCEHHILPFTGKAHVGYIPDGRILGLSKIARLLEIYARRLQVQERLTGQVADSLYKAPLYPAGVIVVVEAQHFCMTMRGVQRPGTITTTSAVRGLFAEDEKSRAEVLSLMRNR